MLSDILCLNNYSMYNQFLANLIGLHNAIYLQDIMTTYNIELKTHPDTLKQNGCYSLVDPEAIKQRTTFSLKEQEEIKKKLVEAGIISIHKDNKDKICIDLNYILSLSSAQLTDSDQNKLYKNLTKKSAEEKKKSKEESIRSSLISSLHIDNQELKEYYCAWIDAYHDRYNTYPSKFIVTQTQKTVTEFSSDESVAKEIMKQAAITGYREISYAIDKYKSLHPNMSIGTNNTVPSNTVKVVMKKGKEVF